MASLVTNNDLRALAKAYDAGRSAAIRGEAPTENPYAYRLEAALYWEWMRGFREYMFAPAFSVQVNPNIPEGEAHFVQAGKIVGRIVNIGKDTAK